MRSSLASVDARSEACGAGSAFLLEAIFVIIILLLALALPGAPEPGLQKQTPTATKTGSEPRSSGSAADQGSLRIFTGQQGSVIFLKNVRYGVTGDSGELRIERIKAGSYPVRVRTVGYQDWVIRLIVVQPQAETRLNVKQIRTTDPAVLHYQKGDALRDSGSHEEAVAEYKQALETNPRLTAAAIGCARSLIAMQQLEDAESMLQKAIKVGGGQLWEAETVFGNLRRSQELLDESISHYRKALVLARGISPEAHIGLALALEEKGAVDEAIGHFRQGLAQDMDTEPILYYLLGKVLEKRGRTQEAIQAYSGYLRLDPNGQYSSAVESIIEQLKGK